jgi:3-keto-5-aminohexanoate cleavage enzyme
MTQSDRSASFVVERAKPGDREAIREVMRPWNMHHVPSLEMEEIDLACFFIARADGRIVGAGGYKVLSEDRGKTTLLGVLPEYTSLGIGRALQEARLKALATLGVKRVTTNADRPRTIEWYKTLYGYKPVGTLEKLHSFGDPDVDRWTTLELDLTEYFAEPVDQRVPD